MLEEGLSRKPRDNDERPVEACDWICDNRVRGATGFNEVLRGFPSRSRGDPYILVSH